MSSKLQKLLAEGKVQEAMELAQKLEEEESKTKLFIAPSKKQKVNLGGGIPASFKVNQFTDDLELAKEDMNSRYKTKPNKVFNPDKERIEDRTKKIEVSCIRCNKKFVETSKTVNNPSYYICNSCCKGH